jgi:uncharacterized membrane protein YjfL (UPF0719 family)
MSGDEEIVRLLCLVTAAVTWGIWFFEAAACARLGARLRDRSMLWLDPLLCAAVLAAGLRLLASWDVRDNPVYLGFYLAMGAAWVGLAARWALPYFGLSARDDVIERGNPAAAHAIGGALLGVTLCFAGGNFGDGPGWWVVVFSAALATGAFFLLWALLDRFTRLADAVTIDRDPASGLRLAGWFVGSGLILGRAVAGDWVSARDTVYDFARLAWPVLLLWIAVTVLERSFRPTQERPLPSPLTNGFAPFAIYVALAMFFVSQAGWWS